MRIIHSQTTPSRITLFSSTARITLFSSTSRITFLINCENYSLLSNFETDALPNGPASPPNGLGGPPNGLDDPPNGQGGPPNAPGRRSRRPPASTVVPNQRMDNVTPIFLSWDQYSSKQERLKGCLSRELHFSYESRKSQRGLKSRITFLLSGRLLPRNA